jgi:hypothetical protein
MRWTAVAGHVAALLVISGCAYGYRSAVVGGYSADSRPDASYFCYDCHGYRFFDPYYDWCVHYGFRYRWADHAQVGRLYRERYVRIRVTHPEYGRYRYRPGYRASTRYREALDYDAWRRGANGRIDRPHPAGRKSIKNAPKKRGGKDHGPNERRGDEMSSSRRGGT